MVLAVLFPGAPPPPCDLARDADGDGEVGAADAVYMPWYLFFGGPPPAAPFPFPGPDRNPGSLGCSG